MLTSLYLTYRLPGRIRARSGSTACIEMHVGLRVSGYIEHAVHPVNRGKGNIYIKSVIYSLI